jgi:glycosyltransferase involved in cell wall biosynthesis
MDEIKPNRGPGANGTVLQVLPELGSGGVERTAVDVSRALTRAGWTSLVASAGGRLVAELPEGSHHITLPLATKNPLRIAANISRIRQVIVEHKVDIVHARSRAPAWSALAAARREGVAFITTYHGAYGQSNPAKGFYNSVMARGDAVIANSAWTAELVKKRCPSAIDRIIPIPRGTDFARFNPARVNEDQRAAMRTHWGVAASDFILLLLGRISPIKGQENLIRAAALVVPEQPALKIVIAGDAGSNPGYADRLQSLIADLDLGDNVILPGLCTQPEVAFAAADCGAMVSIKPETFGRTAIEAAAMERPAVVTDHGGATETVIGAPLEGFTGWKVPNADVEALTKAIREVIALSPAQRLEIGKRARLRAKGKFSLQRMCADTLAVYADTLANRRA